VADGILVVEAGDADEEIGFADLLQLRLNLFSQDNGIDLPLPPVTRVFSGWYVPDVI